MIIIHRSVKSLRSIIKQYGFGQPLTQSEFLTLAVSYSVSSYSINNYQTAPNLDAWSDARVPRARKISLYINNK